jgi:hypothetical protein
MRKTRYSHKNQNSRENLVGIVNFLMGFSRESQFSREFVGPDLYIDKKEKSIVEII